MNQLNQTNDAYTKSQDTKSQDNKSQVLKQFKCTFGKYDEVDITYPLWFKQKNKKWPW